MEVEGLLERLRKHPIGRAIEAEDLAAKLAERRKLIAQIDQLDRSRIASIEPTRSAIGDAQAVVDRAREALAIAERAHGKLIDAENSARVTYDTGRGRLVAELLSLADPSINDFISEMVAETDRTRSLCRSIEGAGDFNHRTGRRPTIAVSNSLSVNRRLNAIRAAWMRAEAMRCEALDHDAIVAELRSLRETLPPVEDPAIEVQLRAR
jgi:hypothetical protein